MISDDDEWHNFAKNFGLKACGSGSKDLDGAARVRPRVFSLPSKCKMNIILIP